MSEWVEVKIIGLDELETKLNKMAKKDASDVIKKALKAGCDFLKERFAENAPVATGFLRSHFSSSIKTSKQDAMGTAFVGPNGKALYPNRQSQKGKRWPARTAALVSRWLEFGTHKMGSRPYITETFEANKEAVQDVMVEKLKDLLKED